MSTTDDIARQRWSEGAPIDARIEEFLADTRPLRDEIVFHPLYAKLVSTENIATFMEHHVFAVLDFMWLLKSLQRSLTCVAVPWLPVGRPATRRFINEIVLGEESDRYGDGWTSHFELYRRAMGELGADTAPIDRFMAALRAGEPTLTALAGSEAPDGAVRSVAANWSEICRGEVHQHAGAFALGRENLIPDMFGAMVDLAGRVPGRLDTLIDYFARHIDLDADVHTPLAFDLLVELCGNEERKWSEAFAAARRALETRLALWDSVDVALESAR
jgi:hypothetical protein